LDQFCKEHSFIGWFETSAKEENGNVNESCKFLIDEIIKNNPVEIIDNEEEKKLPNLNSSENKTNENVNDNKCAC
jgi:Ras-related protein Rab-38